jgi:hypothetical protein
MKMECVLCDEQTETQKPDDLNTSHLTRQLQGMGYIAHYVISRPTPNTFHPLRDKGCVLIAVIPNCSLSVFAVTWVLKGHVDNLVSISCCQVSSNRRRTTRSTRNPGLEYSNLHSTLSTTLTKFRFVQILSFYTLLTNSPPPHHPSLSHFFLH